MVGDYYVDISEVSIYSREDAMIIIIIIVKASGIFEEF